MKITLKIICFSLCWTLWSACAINHSADSKEAYEVEEEMASQEDQLTGSTLPEENLQAFETRAIQKVYDWIDYLNLINSETYDSLMENQLKAQAEALFVDNQLAEPDISPFFAIDKIEILEPLQQTKIGIYEGVLSVSGNNQDFKITFLAKRGAKTFGEEEMMVWKVFLGDLLK